MGNFTFLPKLPFGKSNAFLCQLSLPIHLYLSPLVSSLGGQSCSPPSLVASVLFALRALLLWQRCCLFFFLLLLRVLSALAAPPWCVSSASLGTPAVSTRCHAAGCPSGVPLLATLFRMADCPSGSSATWTLADAVRS